MPMSKQEFLHRLKELITDDVGDGEKEKLLTLKLLDAVLYNAALITLDGLRDDGEALLPYFGRFYLKQRKARRVKPPALKSTIEVPPKTVIKFKPRSTLKELEEILNE